MRVFSVWVDDNHCAVLVTRFRHESSRKVWEWFDKIRHQSLFAPWWMFRLVSTCDCLDIPSGFPDISKLRLHRTEEGCGYKITLRDEDM